MAGRMSGKVAVVTGAARGQGEAEARLFVAEGAQVILTDVLDERGHEVAESIGSSARFVHHDVTSEQDWDRVVAAAVMGFGRLDVLVNNAGVSRIRSIQTETIEDFERVMTVNAGGVFLGIRSAIAPMRAAGGGSIVNIASVAALVGISERIAYTASKFAVRGMTRTAAIELAPYRIRVNAVHPGPIATEMLGGGEEQVGRKLPIGRVGTTDDVAQFVLYLASDESSFVTGSEMAVDGAMTCGKSPEEFGR
ncbi:MAG: 3alpha(or 20beta)-hydroxysteroid dehydrogenase [Acidimicrobiaceae bacterium]